MAVGDVIKSQPTPAAPVRPTPKVVWVCPKCEARNLAHFSYCSKCSEHKPRTPA